MDENDYVAEIREAVQRENRFETERGLAEYLDAGKVKEKVYKITPAVEMYNGKLLELQNVCSQKTWMRRNLTILKNTASDSFRTVMMSSS